MRDDLGHLVPPFPDPHPRKSSLVARFFRGSVDPLLAPVERTIVRAGGMPTSAPWWALVFVVVGGILLVSLLGLIGQQIAAFSAASARGPAGVFVMLASRGISMFTVSGAKFICL